MNLNYSNVEYLIKLYNLIYYVEIDLTIFQKSLKEFNLNARYFYFNQLKIIQNIIFKIIIIEVTNFLSYEIYGSVCLIYLKVEM